MAAQFEGSEILEPGALRNFWVRGNPEHKLSKILFADLPVVHAMNQMLPDS